MVDLDLNLAAASFNLGAVEAFELLTYPLSNKNFLVRLASGDRYIFRVLRGQTQAGLQEEFLIRDAVAGRGVPTSSFLIGNSQERFSVLGQHTITATPVIVGEHPTAVTLRMCQEMGEMLGKFHQATGDITLKNKGWLSREAALRSLQEMEINFELKAPLSVLRQIVDDAAALLLTDLSRGVIHGDYQYQNLLFQGEKIVAVLDFEESENNFLLVDIARSIANLRNWSDFTFAEIKAAFLAGYTTVRPLTSVEVQTYTLAHNYACAACTIWMFQRGYFSTGYNYFNQLTSYPVATDHTRDVIHKQI